MKVFDVEDVFEVGGVGGVCSDEGLVGFPSEASEVLVMDHGGFKTRLQTAGCVLDCAWYVALMRQVNLAELHLNQQLGQDVLHLYLLHCNSMFSQHFDVFCLRRR